MSEHSFGVLMLFLERLVYRFQGLCSHFLFLIWSKTHKYRVHIDSKEGCLTLWCLQPRPSQSQNLQTVVEFEVQEAESDWIFQKLFSWWFKNSHKKTCQNKFLALKHSSQTISYVCCLKFVPALRIQTRYRRSTKSSQNNSQALMMDRSSLLRTPFEAARIQPQSSLNLTRDR